MAQIINFIITLAEMMGLRGVSSYSRASSAYNAIGIVLFALSIFLNVFFIKEVYETKRQMAHIKIQSNEVVILKNKLMEKEAALLALSEALSMFVPSDASARFKQHQDKNSIGGDGLSSVKPIPPSDPSKPTHKLPVKPMALPARDPMVYPDKKYL